MTRRVPSFMSGIAVLLLVVASPVAHLDHHLLTAHMAQHLLLMLVAAPLILIGMRPARLPQPPLAICWLAGSFTVIFWHIPAIFELALESHYWHGFEEASFVIAGILFLAAGNRQFGLVGADLSFPGDLTVRCTFRISRFLRPCRVPAVSRRAHRDVRTFSAG